MLAAWSWILRRITLAQAEGGPQHRGKSVLMQSPLRRNPEDV
jgi:hypothetical protein